MTRLLIAGDFSPQARLGRIDQLSPNRVFGDFLAAIDGADLAVLNLEAPLCGPGQPIVKTGPSLLGPSGAAGFIVRSGFGLACLANNHIMDYGADGLSATMDALRQAKLPWVGAGQDHFDAATPHVAVIGGRKVAILNFAENEWSTTFGAQPGACPVDPVRNFAAIQAARSQADHLVVITHGGHEMHPLPTPRMQELFRFYIDAGADAVINHHPHCISGYEIYRDKPIFYSLGNFLFDNESHRRGPWTQGMAVVLDVNQDYVDFQLHHFDQCTDNQLFHLADEAHSEQRNQEIERLNEIIADPGALEEKFSELTSKRQRLYSAYLEPKLPRIIGAAQRRGWLPSLLTRRHRTLLLNLIRCESHREIVMELLKRDAGHSR